MDVAAIVNALVPVITQIVQGVMKSNGIGLFSAVGMAKGLADFLREAPTKFAGNEIVSSIVNAIMHSGEGSAATTTGEERVNLNDLDLGSVLSSVSGITGLLQGAGAQGEQTKGFIYELAESVAKASGSGLFGTGEKINPAEADFLSKLKSTLGV
jgi:hypothetical protein